MKTLPSLIALVAAGLLLAGCATARHAPPAYEYRVEITGNQVDRIREQVGEWTAQGWDVQSVAGSGNFLYFVLRRTR